ncbi:rRNA-binding ribosome biosynthesis protein [Yamadazyma tenuis]|uniref:Brix domain-containing protein n=2 Tax=Candida tenuis (strain ATCC 10573 / BCRC 21748 / CBS 615 / JCM 9827 / NBRC 10315 / NRRL Y-1498 / VKM Y-70) TaxID=590646 RepID=G3AZA1_CANTC|nr:uncharacterized protein CANTEDRAFT_119160 [Yamadazyma tenuis ATCC 10573]EGV66044.1 hypothetical protein CANTEDRAFT_119160 [Yamadazyma tenuis ATCC 10573]WEJ95612.1 rRNA-binding ribosome biosynthesis protein [Yamadazyma tenuis]
MARRRQKTRTHKKLTAEELAKIPKSMVLRLGSSLKNHSLSSLVRDFRYVMQPHTAINLRERKSNKLKDFIVMAGPLGVSDLFVFKQSESTGNLSLRIGKMPRGPMLQFKINSYSLVKDVQKILKHPKTVGKDSPEFLNPPLLVLNGFSGKMSEAPPHEKLMVTVFQNMFPPIQPQSTRVTSIKRILMINKDPETQEISLRHYAIDTKLVDTSRNIKKLINSHHNLKKSLPIMTKNEDVSDLLLDPYSVGGMTSDSEVEDDAIVDINEENQASATKKVPDQQQPQEITRKKAIKLTELGPRINMSLVKIEEKLTGTSKTIYHSKIVKTPAELKNLEKSAGIKRKLKAERRAKQLENVQAKKDKKDEKKARKKARIADENGENRDIEQDQSSDSDSDSDGPDVDQYEIDSDLYSE